MIELIEWTIIIYYTQNELISRYNQIMDYEELHILNDKIINIIKSPNSYDITTDES